MEFYKTLIARLSHLYLVASARGGSFVNHFDKWSNSWLFLFNLFIQCLRVESVAKDNFSHLHGIMILDIIHASRRKNIDKFSHSISVYVNSIA